MNSIKDKKLYIISIVEEPCNSYYPTTIIREWSYDDYSEAEEMYLSLIKLPFILRAALTYYKEVEYGCEKKLINEYQYH